MAAPSTKTLAHTLATVAPGRSTLLVLDSSNRAVQLSARNLPNVRVITTENVNVYDVLRYEQVVLTTAAARVLEQRYGRAAAAEAVGTAETPSAVEPAETAAETPSEDTAAARAEVTTAEPAPAEAAPAEAAPAETATAGAEE